MNVRALPLLLALALPLWAAETPEIHTTESGLQYQILQPGEPGTEPTAGDSVTVHYVGTLEDGTIFDSSRRRGEPFTFRLGLGEVIDGWDEGLALMPVGATYRLLLPADLAYGQNPPPNSPIPPNAPLTFEVELLRVEKGEPLPELPEAHPDQQQTTASGLVYEAIAAGEGEAPAASDGVTVRYGLWTPEGVRLISSAETGEPLNGMVSRLRLGPFELPFLAEAVQLMKPGARYRFEVPPALAFGDQALGDDLPANSKTLWTLELVKVHDVPAFALPGDDAAVTDSGLRYQIIEPGAEAKPGPTSTVSVNYTGWLTDGTVFDSSHARGESISFSLEHVIPGWREALQLIGPGGEILVAIPPQLAYGDNPPPRSPIPAGATLVFRVELLGVE